MKIFLDTIGCRLNQAEIERYARQFRAAGHTLVADPEEAEMAVINTCAVTAAAGADSRQKVRKMARVGLNQVVVTGCWSTLRPGDAAKLPGVSQVIPNAEKDLLVPQVLGVDPQIFELEPVERELVPGARLRTRAFVKVQDGCDNRCTFCITTVVRGAGRSEPLSNILREIQNLQNSHQDAAQEIVLTGVHLGSWGQDLVPPQTLQFLVQSILSETDIPRLRLSSLEPWDLDEGFFSLWENPRLCRHLHLPLQSGSAATLRRMARKTTPASFAALVDAARKVCPQLAITTDIITGFPGETEQEFQESLEFVQAMAFAGGHVFTYSARNGTAAARMPGQVPSQIRKERNARMREVLSASAQRYQASFIGQTLPVLWESAAGLGPEGWALSGLTDNYLRVRAVAPEHLWNRITPVHLTGLRQDGLLGELIPGSPAAF